MRTKATSVIDVLLGEAVHGTRKQRLADMKAIASVIANRAKELGVTPQDVISAPGEFTAYGKTLPPGVEAYRDLAKQALAEVQQNGPVHSGTFYATPSAKKNLPSGLQTVAKTTGHIYFDDPKNRAIQTALGYRTPDPTAGIISAAYSQPYDMASAGGLFGAPSLMPSANAGPAGRAYGDLVPPTQVATTKRGLEALAPHGLLGTPAPDNLSPDEQAAVASNMADLSYGMGPRRPNAPSSSITDTIRSAVHDVLGPGYSVNVTSGTETDFANPEKSLPQYGSNRHKTGKAADFEIVDTSTGRVLNAWDDAQAFRDVAQAAQAKGVLGTGLGTNYMGGTAMHFDKVQPGPKQANQWGNLGSPMADQFAEARQFSLMPDSFYDRNLPPSMEAPPSRSMPDTLMASAPAYGTAATKQAPVGDQGGVIGASFSQPQEDAPAPDIGVSGSAQGMFGPPGAMAGSFTAPNGEIGFKGGGIGFKGGSVGVSAKDYFGGIGKALDATRQAADMGQPPGGDMFSMADAVNAAKPSIGISGTGTAQAGIGLNAPSFSLSLPAQAPATAPAPAPVAPAPSHLLSPEPLGTPELATPADFPAAPPTPTEAKHPVRDAAKRAAIGGALFGLPGAVIGAASSLLGGEGGIGIGGGMFDGPGPIDKFSVGSGLKAMERAMNGARGATARASNGTEYTSLGPGMGGIRTSGKYGWSEMVGPDGSTRAGGNARGLFGGLADAFGAGGGLLGDRPGGLGGLFGGLGFGGLFGGGEGNRGGFSKAERDKYGGRAGLW